MQFSGQQITITVVWNIPEVELHVNDLVLIVKGDGWSSIRQLQWAYASAAAIGGETACSGWVGDTCRQAGANVKPWASIAFEMDISGPGLYSAVYYSYKRGARMLTTNFNCSVQDCLYDRNHWIRDTGLYVCKPGQFSATDGSGPCFACPSGKFSDAYASTSCSPCAQVSLTEQEITSQKNLRLHYLILMWSAPIALIDTFGAFCCQGYFSGSVLQNMTGASKYMVYKGTKNMDPVGEESCSKCPDGTSTLNQDSTFAECRTCEDLIKVTFSAPGCELKTSLMQTNGIIETTPAPDVCGNGIRPRNSAEECDDGNLANGDGCSSSCKIEIGFKCKEQEGAPMHCYLACGDEQLDVGRETCDDGNTVDKDGCTSLCFVEPGYKCEGSPGGLSSCALLPVCGNQVREWEKGEICDDGGIIAGDGCSNLCTIEPGYSCSNFTYQPDRCCATLELCGNGNFSFHVGRLPFQTCSAYA